jgi:lysophospholipase L1-like esterase
VVERSWGVTPHADGRDRAAVAAEIDRYNAAGCEEAAVAGARWVDVTAQSREAGAGAGWLVDDGLHPSGRAYEIWAQLALPEALAALG